MENGVHLAAVVLKYFLRELEEPIMTFELFDHILKVQGENYLEFYFLFCIFRTEEVAKYISSRFESISVRWKFPDFDRRLGISFAALRGEKSRRSRSISHNMLINMEFFLDVPNAERTAAAKAIIAALPKENYFVLKYIFAFLTEVRDTSLIQFEIPLLKRGRSYT